MTANTGGLNFEDGVVAWLLRLKADLERSEKLDLKLGVDYVLHGFPNIELVKPLDIQLTFQGGNLDKLKAFRDRNTGRDSWKLYVVAEDGMNARSAALQQKNLAKRISKKPDLFQSEKIGLFLNKNGPYRLFNIDRRIEKLMKRADPELSADRRLSGRIVGLGENGAAQILGDDAETYRLRLGDAAAHKLKVLLRMPDAFEEELIGCKVTFIPHEGFALSVLLA